jgi:Protein of unknown function (DUF3253)
MTVATGAMEPARIEAAIEAILQLRGPNASACPSDVARALSPDDWRALMPRVREAASRLANRGLLEIAQGGSAVSANGPWRGPIRLRLPRAD